MRLHKHHFHTGINLMLSTMLCLSLGGCLVHKDSSSVSSGASNAETILEEPVGLDQSAQSDPVPSMPAQPKSPADALSGDLASLRITENPIYRSLSNEQQAIVNTIALASRSGQNSLEFNPPVSLDDFNAAVSTYCDQNAQDLFLDLTQGWTYSLNEDKEVARCEFTTRMSRDEANNRELQILSQIEQIVAQTDGMDAYSKSVFFNDYLADNIVYTREAPNAHFADGALLDGQAVCEGYAKAMSLLLSQAGIENLIMSGFIPEDDEQAPALLATLDSSSIVYDENGQPQAPADMIGHAWSALRLDDGWYYTDSTHNDPVRSESSEYLNLPLGRHTYLNLSWDNMAKTRIFAASQSLMPAYPQENHETFSWFVRENKRALNEDMARDIFCAQAAAMAPVVEMEIPDPALFERVIDSDLDLPRSWGSGIDTVDWQSYQVSSDQSRQVVEWILTYRQSE